MNYVHYKVIINNNLIIETIRDSILLEFQHRYIPTLWENLQNVYNIENYV